MAGWAGKKFTIRNLFTRKFQLLFSFGFILGIGFGRLCEQGSVSLAVGTPSVRAIKREKAGIEFVKGTSCCRAEKVVAVDR